MLPIRRLHNQYISRPFRSGPAELVAWFGAVQAQEYDPAKWGLGQRLRRTTLESDIERAIDAGEILRTHVMRPTWHFVPAADILWMLQLTAPRVHRTVASYNRHQGLDSAFLVTAAAVFERAVAGGRHLTRAELRQHLADDTGRHLTSIQLALTTLYAELERVICSGCRRGKQFTYASISERAPKQRAFTRDEALAELTKRFFQSHGPATIRDFVWWSGLTTADAKRGLEIIRAPAESHDGLTYWTMGDVQIRKSRGAVHLLPIYDEYLVAYRDRVAVPHGPGTIRPRARSPVIFQHAVIVDGQIVGTWRNKRTSSTHVVDVVTLRRISAGERQLLEEAVERYRRFFSEERELRLTVSR